MSGLPGADRGRTGDSARGTMVAISFNSVLIIAAIAVLVPVLLALVPRFPVPFAVLEVIAGIVVGPSVLGWVRVDAPVEVLSDLGLGLLLFLARLRAAAAARRRVTYPAYPQVAGAAGRGTDRP